VVLASREMAADGAQLIECLNTEAITVMQATPVTWQLLLAQGWTGQPELRILCGGEQVSLEVAHQLLDRGHCLWNLYGPTETTVWSTVSALDPQTQRISIGRPIANTQVYLQDPWGHSVPIGVPGELCIGGDGVARGYWHRPDITAQQFVPHPYSSFPGARMYRTGDIARYRADGTLEWMARKDHQIKLRGYRIELGEIEAVLRQQPHVQEAVVMIRDEGVGDQRLVAYVRLEPGHPFDQAGLRESLQKILPGYMMPWVFVGMEAFPLTPNGKIDRKALPAPDGADLTQGASYVAPRTVLEEIIVEVWKEVLKVERIGIHDNFFELGGHSLLATRVIARLRNVLDLDIPLRSLFEYPVIARLAMEIDVQLADIFPDGPKEGS
jgi:acyl-CoA synthetase (AMP-forming)/AMP-acid ligase II/acyl carrier protein